ncbi:hypothetical protein [Brevundimonas sp.]|uniref:hypothetical protein n=1 Tax=Brevundimonas sp. TaxID=1871086 RepID=UPI00289EFF25|nr:hypothetical protein [Brevundimonas sp.]
MNAATRPAVMAALVCGLFGCAGAPDASVDKANVGAFVFLRKEGGWALSRAQPAYPNNAEPRLQALSGAGGATPFGCGLTSVRSSYFSGARGELACVTRAADGRLRFRSLGQGEDFARVYDAAPAPDGYTLIARPVGRRPSKVIRLDALGQVRESIDLPGEAPAEAVLLSTGRIALLRNDGAACQWTLVERERAAFKTVAVVAADPALCHLSNTGGEVLRDQVGGQAYLRSRRPSPNALYRLDDNGAANPATLAVRDFAEGLASGGKVEADLATLHGGVVYFVAPTEAGPILGRHDLASGTTAHTDLRAATGRWQDAERPYGFMVGPSLGPSPRATVMNRAGQTRVLAVQP